jgi:hypothetical protein
MHGATTQQGGHNRLHVLLASVADSHDVQFLTGQFAVIPRSYQPKLLKEYEHRKKTQGRKDANLL